MKKKYDKSFPRGSHPEVWLYPLTWVDRSNVSDTFIKCFICANVIIWNILLLSPQFWLKPLCFRRVIAFNLMLLQLLMLRSRAAADSSSPLQERSTVIEQSCVWKCACVSRCCTHVISLSVRVSAGELKLPELMATHSKMVLVMFPFRDVTLLQW